MSPRIPALARILTSRRTDENGAPAPAHADPVAQDHETFITLPKQNGSVSGNGVLPANLHLDPPESPEEVTRRTFQSYVAGSIASFAGLVVGLPVAGYLAAPLTQKVRAAWISLGRIGLFRPGEPTLVSISVERQDGWRRSSEARTCWVKALAGGRFTVFNGQCTHLGCAYSWRTQGQYASKFVSPCHDGVYDADGNVLGGPPPRPLDTLETRVENGELLVLYQDFQLGVPEKRPI